MRKSVHFRMLLGAGGFAANPDSLPVEFCKRTIISGATLLSNDVIPNGATIISVQAPVGGVVALTGGFPDIQWDDDGAGGLTPASFTYTIQDNVTFQTSTATVTLNVFYAATVCADDGPSFAPAVEFHPLVLSKFGGGTITANDTFGGATSPPPNTANPVTVTVLTPSTPPYVTLFDSSVPSITPFVVPPGINQIEIECWGAQGGTGGNLSAPGAANGQPQQVAGLGAHRLVTNLAVTPGQILSIAVGGAGVNAPTTPGSGVGGNIGTGAAGGQGFADNSTSPTGPGGAGQLDSFGFPDGGEGTSAQGGAGVPPGGDGAGGGGGSDATVAHTVGAGGGGGAGSAVGVGDSTTSSGVPYNRLGPVLNVAGGGGGGSGASVTDVSRGPGQDGGPPAPDRVTATTFWGSHGDGFFGPGATGGGGGGHRGGETFSAVDPFTGQRRGFGGESNDERYKQTSDRAAGNRTPSIQFGAQEIWSGFSGSITTEFPSLQAGNGRVRIRGRTVVDQLGGTQFPIHCKVVDLGATIQITPDIPFNTAGSATNECSFFYFLTDTKTGQISGVCQVRMDIVANVVIAVDDGPFGVIENTNNNIAIATLIGNDTVIGIPTFALVAGGDVNLNVASIIVGPNVVVDPVDRLTSTTASFQYSITDPVMPSGFEFLPGRKTDTATVSLNINLPTPIANDDVGPNVIEELGQGAASVLVAKATLLGNDDCGSQPCTFSTSGLVAVNNCIIVNTGGANVEVKAAGPATDGDCTWQYRVQNAQGAFSGFAIVTHTVDTVSFGGGMDTGFHVGTPSSTRGNFSVPAGMTLMQSEVWGASGGDGNGGVGGSGGAGAKRTCVSNVNPGDQIQFACGQMGTDGSLGSNVIAVAGGSGGGVNISGVAGNNADGFVILPAGPCPLVLDGGIPSTSQGCGGGGGMGGDDSPVIGGGGGGGAGSCVWFGAIITNNIINCASGGGGGGHTGSGAGGGTSASGCNGFGRNMTIPNPFALARGHGGGGGGFRGGDASQNSGAQAGGPGGQSDGNTGRFVSGTEVTVAAPINQSGRVRLTFA